LLASNQEASFGGERRDVTVFFSDIVNITAVAEGLTPEDLVEHLRQYLGVVSTQVLEAGGTVDKYIGDAVMAFWGAPGHNSRHAIAACTATVRCRQRLHELLAKWQA